jgi:hypothetical protein
MNGRHIATPPRNRNKKCFIYRIAIFLGLSGMAGAAQAASLVVASGAGTRK